jgi:hypothetical protein
MPEMTLLVEVDVDPLERLTISERALVHSSGCIVNGIPNLSL